MQNTFGETTPDILKELLILNLNNKRIVINIESLEKQEFNTSKIKTRIHVESTIEYEGVIKERENERKTHKVRH